MDWGLPECVSSLEYCKEKLHYILFLKDLGEGLYPFSLTERIVKILMLAVHAAGLGSSSPFCQVPNRTLFPLTEYLFAYFFLSGLLFHLDAV